MDEKASPTGADKSSALLYECQQLVREFFPLLSIASSQMYVSVPAFVPGNSELLLLYHQDVQNSVTILHHGHRPKCWDACLWTFNGHNSVVYAAVFSPDNSCIASASADFTVQFWDPSSGTHVKTLDAHSDAVLCIAFSSDGTHFLTGSCDCTVKLWDALTKEILFTID